MRLNLHFFIYLFQCFLIFFTSTSFSQESPKYKPNIVGTNAIPFSLTTFNTGEKIDLDKIGEDTIVIIEFWASWCPPCIEAFPHINDLFYELRNEKLKYISVTYETNEDKLKTFFNTHRLNTIIAIDSNFVMYKNYNAWAIPQTMIINKERKIVVNVHPTKLTKEIITDVLQGNTLNVAENGVMPYYEPVGAEEFFKSFEKEVKK
ncbi:MAG: TlpA disulfide reductase family protein [bacterium]